MPQLGLGLTLELRVAQLDRDDRGDASRECLRRARFSSFLLQQVLRSAYLLTTPGERGLEALDVHTALDGGDAVGVAVDALVVAGVPLDRDVERLAVRVVLVLEVSDLENSASFDALRCLTKSTMPPLYWNVWSNSRSGRSSRKMISRPLLRNAIVCNRSSNGAGDELGPLGDEHRGIRPERDRRTGPAQQRPRGRRVADDG